MTEHRAGRRWRTLLAWAGFGVLVLCVLAVAAMYLRGGRTSIGVVIAAALPVVVGVALVAALVSWRHLRWWRLALVVADPRPAAEDGPTITVATLNTAWAGPTDAELVDLADGADVLALQEWDPGRTDGLGRALGPQWRLAASDHDDYIGTDVDVWVRSP